MPNANENGTGVQAALVPMSDAELREAGVKLAALCRDYDVMVSDHAEQRAEMATERKELRGRVAALAQTIREQGR